MIFCDTSTVAKLYVPERESSTVRRILEAEDAVCVSELLRAELLGVFHRRLRERKWTRADFDAAARQFSRDDIGGFWTWLPLDSGITEAVARVYTTLSEAIFLRSADCVHLVTAVRHGFAEVYTHDVHQSAAAPALGLTAIVIAP
jgi:predicted nucleic acid-binding protein